MISNLEKAIIESNYYLYLVKNNINHYGHRATTLTGFHLARMYLQIVNKIITHNDVDVKYKDVYEFNMIKYKQLRLIYINSNYSHKVDKNIHGGIKNE